MLDDILEKRCCAYDCKVVVAQHRLFCHPHWRMLPMLIRSVVPTDNGKNGLAIGKVAAIAYIACAEDHIIDTEEADALVELGYRLQGYNGRFKLLPPDA
jgi:hypothetical protein